MHAISRLSNACKYLTCTVIGSRLDIAKNFFPGLMKHLTEA